MDSDGAGLLTIIVLVGLLATHYASGRDEPTNAETGSTTVASAQRGTNPGGSGNSGDSNGSNGTGEHVVTIGTDVLFEFGTAQLTPTGAGRVASVATKAPQKATVQVNGHTDSVGGSSANQRLSEQRARAVATAIETARPDLRLRVKGFGESQPVADNTRSGRDYPQGREKNRRVEIRY
ncbi:MAG: OmpA family protein [Dermatophilus congolensis]|nr:OmpA family protein [Dermatophilus congolensis]